MVSNMLWDIFLHLLQAFCVLFCTAQLELALCNITREDKQIILIIFNKNLGLSNLQGNRFYP